MLLTIDPTLLTAPVVDEAVPDSDETFPHIYGALDVAAVVRVIPLSDHPAAVRACRSRVPGRRRGGACDVPVL